MSLKFNNDELVAEYLKCNRCRIVAEKYGCSAETVRRALIKANCPRTKGHTREITKKKATKEELKAIIQEYYETDVTINDLAKKYHRSQGIISRAIKDMGNGLKYCEQNGKKIEDEVLRQEIQILSCVEIAQKYNMSAERVYRRAKKLGLNVRSVGGGGHYRRRQNNYGITSEYDEGVTLKRVREKYKDVCQICGLLVDDTDIKDGHIKRMYPTVDHIIPLSKGGSHTWDNVRLAHMACNAGKCDKDD